MRLSHKQLVCLTKLADVAGEIEVEDERDQGIATVGFLGGTDKNPNEIVVKVDILGRIYW